MGFLSHFFPTFPATKFPLRSRYTELASDRILHYVRSIRRAYIRYMTNQKERNNVYGSHSHSSVSTLDLHNEPYNRCLNTMCRTAFTTDIYNFFFMAGISFYVSVYTPNTLMYLKSSATITICPPGTYK